MALQMPFQPIYLKMPPILKFEKPIGKQNLLVLGFTAAVLTSYLIKRRSG